MPQLTLIRVKSDTERCTDLIARVPRAHVGWQSVRYNNRRYQLYGGIRTDFFINVDHPIPTRVHEGAGGLTVS